MDILNDSPELTLIVINYRLNPTRSWILSTIWSKLIITLQGQLINFKIINYFKVY